MAKESSGIWNRARMVDERKPLRTEGSATPEPAPGVDGGAEPERAAAPSTETEDDIANGEAQRKEEVRWKRRGYCSDGAAPRKIGP